MMLATKTLVLILVQVFGVLSLGFNNEWNTIFHQVAIRARVPVLDRIEDFHLCSGLVLDVHFVVTTARCLNLW